MYYGLVTLSVILFGIQFLFSDKYQQHSGTGVISSFLLILFSSLTAILTMGIISGFHFAVTPFSLLIATMAAVNSTLCSFCSLKTLERGNLSVYSLFSMLGGMVLPCIAGIFFFHEGVTLGKILCVLFVGAALPITITKGGSKSAYIYYIGVFIFNGMAGVYPKIYTSLPYPKVTEAEYTTLLHIVAVIIALTVLLLHRKEFKKPGMKPVLFASAGGLLNSVANYILRIALAVLPASVQYPFLTGGVIIVSTLIAAFTSRKPSKKEIIAVILAFTGILLLVLVP